MTARVALALLLMACTTPPGMTRESHAAQLDARRWQDCITVGGTPVRLRPPTGPHWPDAWMCL